MDCGPKLANDKERRRSGGGGEYVSQMGKHDYVS